MRAPSKLQSHYSTRTPKGRVQNILSLHGAMAVQTIQSIYNKTWRDGISMNQLAGILSSHNQFSKVGTTTVVGITGRSYETSIWEGVIDA